MTRCLITGGAGFVGSVLTEELIYRGYSVTVLDTFRHGEKSLNHLCHEPNLKIVRGDARLWKILEPLVNEADTIIPLAGLVGVSECEKDILAANSTNREAIQILCNITDKPIIFPNTNSGYGTSGEEICTEDSPLVPISLYGQTKCAAEQIIRNRGNYTVFRLATVFGMSPRMRWDLMVNNFVLRAVGDRAITLFEPHFRRNFIHVRDVARAFSWAIETPDKTTDQVFNLGNDDCNTTKAGLAANIQQHTKLYVSATNLAEDLDKRNYNVSSAKIAKAGFHPIYSLDRGIQELIKGAQMYV